MNRNSVLKVSSTCYRVVLPWQGLFLAGLLCLVAWPVKAGTGDLFVLPTDPRDAAHGVRLQLDTRWVSGNGYRPVRVSFITEPAVPSSRERAFHVTLEPMVHRGNSLSVARPEPLASRWASVAVTQRVVIPEGALEGQATLLMPQSSVWHRLRVRIEEDGQVLAECSAPDGIALSPVVEEWTEVSPTVMLVTRHAPRWNVRDPMLGINRGAMADPTTTLPQLLEFAKMTPGNLLSRQLAYLPGLTGSGLQGNSVPVSGPGADEPLSDQMLQAYLRELAKVELLAADDVPTNWIELSCIDLMFVDQRDVSYLAEQFPAKWNSIRTWVEAGQTLIVFGLDAEFQQLGELERLMGINIADESAAQVAEAHGSSDSTPQAENQTAAESASTDQVSGPGNQALVAGSGWEQPNTSDYGVGFADLSRLMSNRYGLVLPGGIDSLAEPSERESRLAGNRPAAEFQRHNVGLGRVVAVAAKDPFQPNQNLAWVLNSLEPNHWSWFVRYGMSLGRDNLDVRQMQIPGVGEPPRTTYLVLITLFALVIGPLNYWALWRFRRLHLLLVTVPLAALGVTLLLMAYVVVRDGFQTRVQARSLTLLDQRQGRAVNWSTQSYFSGLPPADGLRFSDATLVYPLDAQNHAANVLSRNRGLSLQLHWLGDQNLRGGYLRPRETQHFVVVSAGNQPARLDIEPRDSVWQVTNELGGTIRYLLIHAAPGEFYRGENLGSGEVRLIDERGGADARGRIVELFQEFDISTTTSGRPYPQRSDYTIDLGIADPRLATGIMETWLSKIRIEPEATLPPRSYVAFVDWPDWFEVGVPQPRRERSLHVIVGYY